VCVCLCGEVVEVGEVRKDMLQATARSVRCALDVCVCMCVYVFDVYVCVCLFLMCV
jgi:hypothetical protein